MAILKTVYDNQEDIPAGYEALYSERNGRWELTQIEGVKTPADVERVQTALNKERGEHKATKQALEKFGDLNPDEVHTTLERVPELEAQLEAAKKGGKLEGEELEKIVTARINQATGPLAREKQTLERKLLEKDKLITDKDSENANLRTTITAGNIDQAVRAAAIESKMTVTAIPDALIRARSAFEITEDGKVITKDGTGYTPGLSPKEWVKEMQEQAPHWWPASQGGGANGGGANGGKTTNPWMKANWNITAQGQYVKQHGVAKAEEAAKQAGSTLGATKPPAA